MHYVVWHTAVHNWKENTEKLSQLHLEEELKPLKKNTSQYQLGRKKFFSQIGLENQPTKIKQQRKWISKFTANFMLFTLLWKENKATWQTKYSKNIIRPLILNYHNQPLLYAIIFSMENSWKLIALPPLPSVAVMFLIYISQEIKYFFHFIFFEAFGMRLYVFPINVMQDKDM